MQRNKGYSYICCNKSKEYALKPEVSFTKSSRSGDYRNGTAVAL